ncbi:unnamed protein product, partial [Pylaiella littoralis]
TGDGHDVCFWKAFQTASSFLASLASPDSPDHHGAYLSRLRDSSRNIRSVVRGSVKSTGKIYFEVLRSIHTTLFMNKWPVRMIGIMWPVSQTSHCIDSFANKTATYHWRHLGDEMK